MLCSVVMVTGLRACAGVVPRGECELHRVWDGDGGAAVHIGVGIGVFTEEYIRGVRRADARSVVVVVVRSARDMVQQQQMYVPG